MRFPPLSAVLGGLILLLATPGALALPNTDSVCVDDQRLVDSAIKVDVHGISTSVDPDCDAWANAWALVQGTFCAVATDPSGIVFQCKGTGLVCSTPWQESSCWWTLLSNTPSAILDMLPISEP